MKHLGDITKLHGFNIPPVDVITGGSPCQDLSIAGPRKGLNGERSGLFMDQIRIIKEMRKEDERNGRTGVNVRPRYMVWENVTGALSSNKGEDFRTVLEETARVKDKTAAIPGPPGGKWSNSGVVMGDRWSIAWRVHDAQFWGVPQRRRRIALVADFGGDTAPEILFERESVSGDIETGRKAEEGTAGGIETCTYPAGDQRPIARQFSVVCAGFVGGQGAACSIGYQVEIAPTLRATQAVHVYENHAKDSRITGPLDVAPTVSRKYGTGGNNVPLVMTTGQSNAELLEDCGTTLNCNHEAPIVFHQKKFGEYGCGAGTLMSSAKIGGTEETLVISGSVRRLMPLECERLQGYPDGWTNIEWDEVRRLKSGPKIVHKTASDTQRYRAIGNSIALPPWRWVLSRIAAYLPDGATLGSLFDGIGGFPLIWQEINGPESAMWASEIENFPMQVTKRNIP